MDLWVSHPPPHPEFQLTAFTPSCFSAVLLLIFKIPINCIICSLSNPIITDPLIEAWCYFIIYRFINSWILASIFSCFKIYHIPKSFTHKHQRWNIKSKISYSKKLIQKLKIDSKNLIPNIIYHIQNIIFEKHKNCSNNHSPNIIPNPKYHIPKP